MGFDFPNTPNPGDISNGYTWDGQKWTIVSDGGNFIQVGAGAVTRTMQDKDRDLFSVLDFATATQASSAAIAAFGGGTIIVPNGTAPTLPAVYPGVTFDYFGPNTRANLREDGLFTDVAMRLLRTQMSLSSTSGISKSSMVIECKPVGSTVNGPSQGSYGLKVGTVKQNWMTTTQGGEIGGVCIFVRNGGFSGPGGLHSDTSAILNEVITVGSAGFSCGWEGVTYNITPGGTTVTAMDYQLGVIDMTGGDSYGMVLTVLNGTVDRGVLVQAANGTHINTPFIYATTAGALFYVDSNGAIYGNEIILTGTPWTAYTSTALFSSGSGSANGRYKKIGKTIFVTIGITCATNGAIASASLPVQAGTSYNGYIFGREGVRTGASWTGSIVAGDTVVRPSSGALTAMAAGDIIALTGIYECA